MEESKERKLREGKSYKRTDDSQAFSHISVENDNKSGIKYDRENNSSVDLNSRTDNVKEDYNSNILITQSKQRQF